MTEIPKQKVIRLPGYLEWIRTRPCVDCGSSETVPHHILKHTDSGKQLKPSDFYCVPLCHHHHMQIHNGHAPDKPLTLAAGFMVAYAEEQGEYAIINDALRALGESIQEME